MGQRGKCIGRGVPEKKNLQFQKGKGHESVISQEETLYTKSGNIRSHLTGI